MLVQGMLVSSAADGTILAEPPDLRGDRQRSQRYPIVFLSMHVAHSHACLSALCVARFLAPANAVGVGTLMLRMLCQ